MDAVDRRDREAIFAACAQGQPIHLLVDGFTRMQECTGGSLSAHGQVRRVGRRAAIRPLGLGANAEQVEGTGPEGPEGAIGVGAQDQPVVIEMHDVGG